MSARSHLGHTIYRNHKDFNEYLDRIAQGKSPVEETFPLDLADRKTQFVARTLGDGLPLDRSTWEAAFGESIDKDYGDLLARLRAAQLIEDQDGQISLAETGKLIFDVITIAFYPPTAQQWLRDRQSPQAAPRRSLAP